MLLPYCPLHAVSASNPIMYIFLFKRAFRKIFFKIAEVLIAELLCIFHFGLKMAYD